MERALGSEPRGRLSGVRFLASAGVVVVLGRPAVDIPHAVERIAARVVGKRPACHGNDDRG